jgi:hypothetical protein
MPVLRIETVGSIPDYTALAGTLVSSPTTTLWFRGIGNASHRLIPSLYRHPTKTDVKDLIELEFDILNRFRHRSIPFQQRPLTTDWEHLFFMQHYGVPTRLLDWSENLLVALYFAILSAEENRDPDTGAFTSDAAVWILNPQMWNEHVLGPAWRNRILAIPDQPLDSYKPTADLKSLQTKPIAMAGLHNSSRIVAQRGAFTIFGSDKKPMEEIFEAAGFPDNSLVKVVLPLASIAEFQKSIFNMGYSDSMIYPDLLGLAMEIKRQFGFPI